MSNNKVRSYLLKAFTIILSSWISMPYAISQQADIVITNGVIYTVDSTNPWADAIAIDNGRILSIGSYEKVSEYVGPETKVIDAQKKFIMPGFIESHGHFSGLGQSLQNLNFLKSPSWQAIVDDVNAQVLQSEPGEWIVGRGWHQEKWIDTIMENVLGYPYHDALSAISPDNPVVLWHASGHGLMANSAAMQAAGVNNETLTPDGGNIVRDMNGRTIGVFEENAMQLINEAYREYTTTLSSEVLTQQWYEGIALAQTECLENGVTSFQDAGTSLMNIERYKEMALDNKFDVRLWSMIRHTSEYLKNRLKGYPIVDIGDGFFTCRAIKLSIDGALGSYGAWLLEPYDDNPGKSGLNTKSLQELNSLATLCYDKNMQLCVHAIGDKANREVLNSYETFSNQLKDPTASLRWRVEHAQHLHPNDISRFSELGVIAVMQGIHCTSDAPFVEKRLGYERAQTGAYVWQSLLESGAVVTNGTDTPVEDIDPIASFYASVTRKRTDSGFEFFTEQAMTRDQAIYSYTMACAYSAFEEKSKGSLAIGKYADLVILSNDLINCSDNQILDTKVLMTMVDGEIKYTSASWSEQKLETQKK